jgi:hypothetical protein
MRDSERRILAGMIRSVAVFVVGAISFGAFSLGQSTDGARQAQLKVIQLPPPKYPPMALAAHVFGEVELRIRLRADGTLDAAEATSGPPMLREPAAESARQIKFAFEDCQQSTNSFKLTHWFELGETLFCTSTRNSGYPRVTQTVDVITIADQPMGTCDLAGTIEKVRARSARCLYLRRCGWRSTYGD